MNTDIEDIREKIQKEIDWLYEASSLLYSIENIINYIRKNGIKR